MAVQGVGGYGGAGVVGPKGWVSIGVMGSRVRWICGSGDQGVIGWLWDEGVVGERGWVGKGCRRAEGPRGGYKGEGQ